jgi:hypothetical protein
MASIREQNIQSAIDDFRDGKTLRKAAEDWEIPKSTLSERLYGSTSRKASKINA